MCGIYIVYIMPARQTFKTDLLGKCVNGHRAP